MRVGRPGSAVCEGGSWFDAAFFKLRARGQFKVVNFVAGECDWGRASMVSDVEDEVSLAIPLVPALVVLACRYQFVGIREGVSRAVDQFDEDAVAGLGLV